ncbi:MAG: hypothetical protein U1F60_00080 [Planctomycetota bacterium]
MKTLIVALGLVAAFLLGLWLARSSFAEPERPSNQVVDPRQGNTLGSVRADSELGYVEPARERAVEQTRLIQVVDTRLIPVADAVVTTMMGQTIGLTDLSGCSSCSMHADLVVTAKGFLPALVRADSSDSNSVVVVVMRAAADLVVRVRDPWGEPVDGVAVSIRPLPSADGPPAMAYCGASLVVGKDGRSLAPAQVNTLTSEGVAHFSGLDVGTLLVQVGKRGWVQASFLPSGVIYRPLPVPIDLEGSVVDLDVTLRPVFVAVLLGLPEGSFSGRYADQFLRLGYSVPKGADSLPPFVPELVAATNDIKRSLHEVHGEAVVRVFGLTPGREAQWTQQMTDEVVFSTPTASEQSVHLVYVPLETWTPGDVTIVSMGALPDPCELQATTAVPCVLSGSGGSFFGPQHTDPQRLLQTFIVPAGDYQLIPSSGLIRNKHAIVVAAKKSEATHVRPDWEFAELRVEVADYHVASAVVVSGRGVRVSIPIERLPTSLFCDPGETELQVLDHALLPVRSLKVAAVAGEVVRVTLP